MSLVVLVIGAGGNAAEAEMFHGVFGNVKFWVLDLEMGLSKSLEDVGEGEEKQLKRGSHEEDHNSQQSLYSLSTAKALPRFYFDFQVCLVLE